LDQILMHFIN